MGEQNITNQYEVLKIVAEQNQEFIMEYEAGMDTMQVYILRIKNCIGRR